MSEPEVTPETTETVENQVKETKPKKPKRKCSQKQLAALAAGRAKNKHFKPKSGS